MNLLCDFGFHDDMIFKAPPGCGFGPPHNLYGPDAPPEDHKQPIVFAGDKSITGRVCKDCGRILVVEDK